MEQKRTSRVPRPGGGRGDRTFRAGTIDNSLVINGDNNQVTINVERNIIVDPLNPAHRPAIKRRPVPVLIGTPTHPINLLDRDAERGTVQSGFQAGNCIEFYGDEGMGKTTLLRYLSTQPQRQLPDGVIVIDKRISLEDLLQELFEAFFYSDKNYRPTLVDCKRRFMGIRALILIDNFTLSREDTQVLINTLPNCVFALASNEQHLWERCNVIHLCGLPLADAMTLFQQQVRRPLSRNDLAAAQAICHAVQGNPLRILRAAALVSQEGKTVQEVARSIPGADPSAWVLQQTLSNLSGRAKSVLGLLATFKNVPLPAEHIKAMVRDEQLGASLGELLNRGLVKAHSPSYSLTGNLAAHLERNWNLAEWREAGLQYFMSWASRSPSKEQILASAQPLMVTLENAASANRWREVAQIGWAIEPAFMIGCRWGLWERLLNLIRQASLMLKDRAIEAWTLHQLGSRALCLGHAQEAHALLSRALEIRRAIGDRAGVSATQHNLNMLGGGGTPTSSRGLTGKSWIIPLVVVVAVVGAIIASPKDHTVSPPPIIYTNTARATDTFVPTPVRTFTPTITKIPSKTPTGSVTPSRTPTRTPTGTITPSITPSWTPTFTRTPTFTFTPTNTFTPTSLPPAGSIWLSGGCNDQYDAGVKVQLSTQVNQDAIITVLFGDTKVLDFVSVRGNDIKNIKWTIPDNYGQHDLILMFYDSTYDTWYELNRCSIYVWDSTPPSAPSGLSPGSASTPAEKVYSCPVILSWSNSYDLSGIQKYEVHLESCDYSYNCGETNSYTTSSTSQDITTDIDKSVYASIYFRWYVYAIDGYANYSARSEYRYFKFSGCSSYPY